MKKIISFFLLIYLSVSAQANTISLKDIEIQCNPGLIKINGEHSFSGRWMYPQVASGRVQGKINFVQLVEEHCKSNQIKLSSYKDVLNLPIYEFACTAPSNNICGNKNSRENLRKILDDEFGSGFTDNFGVIGEVVSFGQFSKDFQTIMQCHNANWDNIYRQLLSTYGKANKGRADKELAKLKSECKKWLSITPKQLIEKNRKLLNR